VIDTETAQSPGCGREATSPVLQVAVRVSRFAFGERDAIAIGLRRRA